MLQKTRRRSSLFFGHHCKIKRGAHDLLFSLRSIGAVDGSHVLLYRERDGVCRERTKKETDGKEGRSCAQSSVEEKGRAESIDCCAMVSKKMKNKSFSFF